MERKTAQIRYGWSSETRVRKKTSRNQIHITLFTHQVLFTHQEEHTQPTHSPLLLCKLLGSLELWG